MTERQDARQFTQYDEFIDAINRLVSTGEYSALVWHHANMAHAMHTMFDQNGRIIIRGSRRFLPWHRQYLIVFERLLQTIDDKLSIPYWDWTEQREFPPELVDFQSDLSFTVRPSSNNADLPDTTHPFVFEPHLFDANRLPTPETLEGAMNETDYIRFSLELEGALVFNDTTGEARWPVTGEGLHNLVHGVVGGIMSNIRFSPANPIFWLHHANIDRIWMNWQSLNPDQHPQLTGEDALLDPWTPVTVDDIIDPTTLPYRYI